MAKHNRVVSMEKYKRKGNMNIGVFLFGVIFLYLLITIFTFITKERIAVYEVREGSILKDTAYTGIALREESVIYADKSGYINYFVESGDKIAVGSNIYTLSPNELKSMEEAETNDEVALSNEEWNQIQQRAQSFNKSFRNSDYSTVTALKQETTAIIQDKTTQNRVVQLTTLLENNSVDGLEVYQAIEDGIIQFSIDGFEGMTMSDLENAHIDKLEYKRTELTNNTKVSSGSPIYRIITGEKWNLIFKLDPDMVETLRDMMGEKTYTNVKIRFLKDNQSMKGALQIFDRSEDEAFGYITFSNSMIRYAQDRYLDIELILEDETGLKIPKSSVTEKEFYTVPTEFLTVGGGSKQTGVLRQNTDKKGNQITEFLPVTVFYKDEATGMAYLEPSAFKAGDVLVMPESTQTTAIGSTGILQGVYNVNKGFAIFKRIEILCESEEYYIIKEGSSYGLSNYDRIALDGSSVVENQIVNQ